MNDIIRLALSVRVGDVYGRSVDGPLDRTSGLAKRGRGDVRT